MKITARILYSVDVNSPPPCVATIFFEKEDGEELPIQFAGKFGFQAVGYGNDRVAYKLVVSATDWVELEARVRKHLLVVYSGWRDMVTKYRALAATMPQAFIEVVYDDSEPSGEPE